MQQPNPAAKVDLGYAAAFPIILIGPGVVGSLWSVFLFKAPLHRFPDFGIGADMTKAFKNLRTLSRRSEL